MILILALGILGTAQGRTLMQAKADGTLHMYTGTDFAPFSSLIGAIAGDGSQPVGFEVELGNLIADRLGLKPVWQVKDFDTLIPSIVSNPDVDVLIASHAITSTRLEQVDFTNPHYCTGGVALTKKDGPLTSKAFGNRDIGAEQGSTYEGYLAKLPMKVNLKTYPNSEETYKALASGEVVSVVTDLFAAMDASKQYAKESFVVGPLLWRESVGMVVAKGNDELRQAINGVLAELLKDGTYAKLSQRYFQQDIRC